MGARVAIGARGRGRRDGLGSGVGWWGEADSNRRRQCHQIYSLAHLAALEPPRCLVRDRSEREPTRGSAARAGRPAVAVGGDRSRVVLEVSRCHGTGRSADRRDRVGSRPGPTPALCLPPPAAPDGPGWPRAPRSTRGSWSQRWESNPQPPDYKSGALPIELRWPSERFATGTNGAPPTERWHRSRRRVERDMVGTGPARSSPGSPKRWNRSDPLPPVHPPPDPAGDRRPREIRPERPRAPSRGRSRSGCRLRARGTEWARGTPRVGPGAPGGSGAPSGPGGPGWIGGVVGPPDSEEAQRRQGRSGRATSPESRRGGLPVV